MIALTIVSIILCGISFRQGSRRAIRTMNDQIAADIFKRQLDSLSETPIAEAVARDLGIDLRSIRTHS
jgi:predicted secreted Zn-dependent protease